MTGAYLRVKRGGEWHNVEVEHLTDEELIEKFTHRESHELVNWMRMLCEKIRQLEPLLKSLEADGIIEFVQKTPEPVETPT